MPGEEVAQDMLGGGWEISAEAAGDCDIDDWVITGDFFSRVSTLEKAVETENSRQIRAVSHCLWYDTLIPQLEEVTEKRKENNSNSISSCSTSKSKLYANS